MRAERRPALLGRPTPFRRCLAFALILSLFIIVTWGVWKVLAVGCEVANRNGLASARVFLRYSLTELMTSRSRWIWLSVWEIWSLSRLWVPFAILTLVLSGIRGDIRMGLRRLLLFAPWLIVLELAFLFLGTFICSCIPEPSTLFYSDWEYVRWQTLVNAFWLKRAAVPSLIVGVFFLRYVISMRWRSALPLALLVYPLVALVTILWSILYEQLRIFRIQ